MSRKLFVNLPVRDLKTSMAFFEKLGFSFNPQFTDDSAACMVISEENFAMLLSHERLKDFTPKAIADATKTTEVLVAISCENRDVVDAMVHAAIENGGSALREASDYGFMYAHSFQDPDGHIWEPFWMDPDRVQG
ncbi:VOC family protein [Rubinisphaera margarita]|uniref:VOC family protein n=1 Tax=Rubinisphaera margarita TaxID=2909586 RepID=UPI001EE97096|nr:VOC family protein [Rubinisphaera margarita]MCG6157773.1 VOC family protein [Rubinisphaera margarita]